MRMIVGALAALTVASCGGDVLSTRLTPDLLERPADLQKVANRLEPADRPVLERYLLSRSAGFGFGKPIQILTPEGKDPATVGEALALTRQVMALEAERDAKMEASIKARDALPPDHTAAQYNVHVDAHNAAIAEFDRKLAALQGRPYE